MGFYYGESCITALIKITPLTDTQPTDGPPCLPLVSAERLGELQVEVTVGCGDVLNKSIMCTFVYIVKHRGVFFFKKPDHL